MSDGEAATAELERPDAAETALLVARTERLAPLYDAAAFTMTWGWRLGAVLLTVGIIAAGLKGEALGQEADPIVDVLAAVMAGRAAGVIDLAILWFMLTPVATVIVVAISFWRLGDRRYALLSLVVLAILAASIALTLSR
jgi:hypothetical protein